MFGIKSLWKQSKVGVLVFGVMPIIMVAVLTVAAVYYAGQNHKPHTLESCDGDETCRSTAH